MDGARRKHTETPHIRRRGAYHTIRGMRERFQGRLRREQRRHVTSCSGVLTTCSSTRPSPADGPISTYCSCYVTTPVGSCSSRRGRSSSSLLALPRLHDPLVLHIVTELPVLALACRGAVPRGTTWALVRRRFKTPRARIGVRRCHPRRVGINRPTLARRAAVRRYGVGLSCSENVSISRSIPLIRLSIQSRLGDSTLLVSSSSTRRQLDG